MHFLALFHTASTLSGSLRSPPSPRGEGFVRRYSFSTYACIRFDDARKAVSPFRSLPHWGRGTASAVDRVLSQTAYLRRFLFHLYHLLETIFFALFHPARTLSGSLRSPPSPRGEGFISSLFFLHVSYIRFEDAGIAASSYRSLPHWGRLCRRKRYSRFFIRPTQKRPSLTSGRFYVYYLLRETLIKSQNSISHVFSCNASSYSSLNSSLFASKYSLHCMKIYE